MQEVMPENKGIDEVLFRTLLIRFINTPGEQDQGLIITYLGPGTIGLKMQAKPERANSRGWLHGGAISSMADTAMGWSVCTLGLRGVTLDLNVNYFAPVPIGTEIVAEGKVLHAGKTIIVAEATLNRADNGKLVARSRGTFFLVPVPD